MQGCVCVCAHALCPSPAPENAAPGPFGQATGLQPGRGLHDGASLKRHLWEPDGWMVHLSLCSAAPASPELGLHSWSGEGFPPLSSGDCSLVWLRLREEKPPPFILNPWLEISSVRKRELPQVWIAVSSRPVSPLQTWVTRTLLHYCQRFRFSSLQLHPHMERLLMESWGVPSERMGTF